MKSTDRMQDKEDTISVPCVEASTPFACMHAAHLDLVRQAGVHVAVHGPFMHLHPQQDKVRGTTKSHIWLAA